jgi:hypothetical protein
MALLASGKAVTGRLTLRTAGLALAVLMFCGAPDLSAQAGPDREHRIKAVFLFNFAQFVQWPEKDLGGPEEPMVVGVLGEDPFDAYLDEVVKGEKVNNRPIVVKRFKRIEDVHACHVLFVSVSESSRFESIIAGLKSRGILTVGESQDFCKRGGMVCFATENGKIRLKINLEAVQEAHLTVSSKLLRLADVSGPKKE